MNRQRKITKIVFIVTTVQSANSFTYHQIKSIKNEKYEIYLICGFGALRNEIIQSTKKTIQIKYFVRRLNILFDLITVFKLILILKELKPDILIYSTPKAALLSAVASIFTKAKIKLYQIWGCWWINDKLLKRYYAKKLELIILKLSTDVTVVSKSIQKFYNREFQLNNKSFFLISEGSTTGVNTNIFYFKRDFQNNRNFKLIGFAGRICKDKGIEDLVRVYIELRKIFPNLKLELIGSLDQANPVSNEIMNIISNDALINRISELDQNQLADRMRNWDLQVFLSTREGLGNVVIEAGACGIPTVAWDIDGVKDSIPNFFKIPLLIPYKDFNKLHFCIDYYLKFPIGVEDRIKLSNWTISKYNEAMVRIEFNKFINNLISNPS